MHKPLGMQLEIRPVPVCSIPTDSTQWVCVESGNRPTHARSARESNTCRAEET